MSEKDYSRSYLPVVGFIGVYSPFLRALSAAVAVWLSEVSTVSLVYKKAVHMTVEVIGCFYLELVLLLGIICICIIK